MATPAPTDNWSLTKARAGAPYAADMPEKLWMIRRSDGTWLSATFDGHTVYACLASFEDAQAEAEDFTRLYGPKFTYHPVQVC